MQQLYLRINSIVSDLLIELRIREILTRMDLNNRDVTLNTIPGSWLRSIRKFYSWHSMLSFQIQFSYLIHKKQKLYGECPEIS